MPCFIISQLRIDLSPAMEEYLFDSAQKLALTCDSITSCKVHLERRGRGESKACDLHLTLRTNEHSLHFRSSSTCDTQAQMVVEAADLAFDEARRALETMKRTHECVACSH